MILLEKVPELKYSNQPFHLPYNNLKPNDNYMIGLLVKNTNDAVTVFSNKMVVAKDRKYARYFKPAIYKDKIYNHTINEKLSPSDKSDLNSFTKTMGLTFFDRANAIKNKNVVVDTSLVTSAFFSNCQGKNYLDICRSFVDHLTYYFNTVCKGLDHENRFLIINVSNWGISSENKSKIISANHKALNPMSIIYTLLLKDPDKLEKLNPYELIVLDNDSGWFRWNISNREKDTADQIKRLFQKFRNQEITDHLEGSNVEENEEEKQAIAKNIANKLKEDNESSSSDEDNEDESELSKAIKNEGISEEDIEMALKDIEDNYDTMSRAVPTNKRFEDLRKKQYNIKVHNVSMGNILEGKVPDYHIETTDISDKVFTPNDNIKKIRFDNVNKSYTDKVRTRDLMSVFSGLNDSTIPVVVKSIKVENTSDSMNLKETWHVKLESADGVEHSVTVDLPLVYDNNYMYLGGNRKQFVNQNILLPLIKISPTTVQIVTNYSKNFIHRYGDILSPKVTVFKKIIANNPQYFSIVRGNGIALSKSVKTSIEYDSIAKDFVSVTIKGKGIGFNFDQGMYKKMIENKQLKPIDDNYIYCVYDARNNAPIKAYPASINAEAMSSESDEQKDYGVLDLFTTIFKKETGKDFWELAGPKDKPGKRFMYSRVKIMEKWIPCILLMAYFEGLTRVLNKAKIKYEFKDKRARITFDKGMIEFADGYLVYERNPTSASLLLNGLTLIDTKAYKYEEFDKPGIYLDIFEALYGMRSLAPKLDAFYDNMIDPVTKEILIQMDLPTDYVGLIAAANELLADNSYQSEIDQRNFRVRNMEMIYVHLYQEIANAYSNYRRTAANRNPEKISIPKNAVIKRILTSQVCEDVSVINPITEKEKLHSNTNKGPMGINLSQAYTKDKRCFDKTMMGIQAVSTSPDANCGVVREYTVEPKIINSRGFIDCDKSIEDMKDVNLFSYAEMLTPLGITNDDSIRTSMASKQSF